MTTPKVARISRLRQKRASRESFSNCRYEVATRGASTTFNFARVGPRFAAHPRCAPAVAFGDFAPPRACGRRRREPKHAPSAVFPGTSTFASHSGSADPEGFVDRRRIQVY